jgi:hypothetical protein
MDRTVNVSDHSSGLAPGALAYPNPRPLAGSFITGVIASLCCGGSLIFASIGLGAFYSALGLSRFIPQALAAGAISIVAINYLFYRHAAKQASGRSDALRAKMFIGTAIGLVMMAGTFILLEWLNHGIVHADRFLARPELSQALIKGVPNIELAYVGATFFALLVLWALPFPPRFSTPTSDDGWMKRAGRVAVLGATSVLIIGVVLDASGKFGTPAGGHGAPAGSHGSQGPSPHAQAHY